MLEPSPAASHLLCCLSSHSQSGWEQGTPISVLGLQSWSLTLPSKMEEEAAPPPVGAEGPRETLLGA